MDAAARDLFDTTLAWSRPWWDPDVALLWNPDGAFPDLAPGRTLHQVPNSAWYAWALLATGDGSDRADAQATIDALLDLQHDQPGSPAHGTFRRFLEWPEIVPDDPTMWEDYDPNWRQFIGTTFALVVEDFGDRVGADRLDRVVDSIGLAARSEPDDRIPLNYTNPGLMRAWLDAWYGARVGDRSLVDRGETLGRRLAERFDRVGAFDEFNSPTYNGTDLQALAQWVLLPPTPWFAEAGARLETGLWRSMLDRWSPTLRNWAGPYTRAYHPDASRSVAKAGLWMWAVLGREHAPVPALERDVDHGHDLFAGPVIARLAHEVAGVSETDVRALVVPRSVELELLDGRRTTSVVGEDVLIGAEASDHDWGGWDQFVPFVAHWRAGGAVNVLWLAAPRRVSIGLEQRDRGWSATVRNAGCGALAFWLQGAEVATTDTGLVVDGAALVLSEPVDVVERSGPDRFRIGLGEGVESVVVGLPVNRA